MKRVLHIMGSLERSGMEMMLMSSAEQWRCAGYSCDLLATKHDVGPLAEEMRRVGYGIWHIPFRSGRRYLPSRRLIPEFFRLCKQNRYDIVHIHTEAATPIFVILAKLAGVSNIVLSVHSTFLFDGLLRTRKKLERMLIRALGGRYGMVSDAVMECERERFHNPGVRVWNWLDTEYFRPPSAEERQLARQSLGCTDGQFVLVSVGNCSRIKNHSALLRALPQLKQVPFLYLHVGKEEPARPELALAAQLGLENEVRFMGSQPDPRLFFWAADVFVMPSLYEGLGNSALEAIASGCPAVLSDRSGLKEIANETKWAISVALDEDSIAAGLLRVAGLPANTRRSRALEDSTRIRARFSMQRGVQVMIENLYIAPTDAAIPSLQTANPELS
ncbi:glycosyltransferase [Edaphobacter aggregans]|uniref:glycosyltransferase n=1 Tax=Edaphobacter aggregans TaxID=570835 RepID=UPI0005583EBE|nr:glycosyltransferase [Edaphobacter aggregans]